MNGISRSNMVEERIRDLINKKKLFRMSRENSKMMKIQKREGTYRIQ
jgi:hypothetical protein